MSTPRVSVIMPLYNAAPFVEEAVRSVLDQSITDLELVVVDDGSTDRSAQVVAGMGDARVKLIRQENRGVAHALNAALAKASAPYIARQDADDASLPDRLKHQLERFEQEPSLSILGAWSLITDAAGEPLREQHQPLTDAAIRFALLFDTPFVSSSVMFKRTAAERAGGFDPGPDVHDDWDMWSRLCRQGRAANLPEVLVRYRVLPTGLTRTMPRFQERSLRQRRENIRWALPGLPPDLAVLLEHLGIDYPIATPTGLRALHGELFTFIMDLTTDKDERAVLERDLRAKLMSARLVPHHSPVHRVLDHLRKRCVLGSLRRGEP
ncbi:MAG: glycosyltransferase family 2 protein [Flavobacteriales bacterium]|nr:MAG: glycosyltransferase family 2 protein [Flavobacteriales bacterium]